MEVGTLEGKEEEMLASMVEVKLVVVSMPEVVTKVVMEEEL